MMCCEWTIGWRTRGHGPVTACVLIVLHTGPRAGQLDRSRACARCARPLVPGAAVTADDHPGVVVGTHRLAVPACTHPDGIWTPEGCVIPTIDAEAMPAAVRDALRESEGVPA